MYSSLGNNHEHRVIDLKVLGCFLYISITPLKAGVDRARSKPYQKCYQPRVEKS